MPSTIGDLVDLHHYEEENIVLRPVGIALDDLAEGIRTQLDLVARRKRILLLVFAPSVSTHADPDIVLRIMLNLASNALKFSPAGSTVAVTLELVGEHLGLAIVKRLVEVYRGQVSCESTLGAGATFRVELPAETP
jgi:signal transduction histidine kinase